MYMRRSESTLLWRVGFIVVLLAFPTATLVAQGAPMTYGPYTGDTVTFVSVTEASVTDPLPLFDEPAVVGNSLIFDPTSSFVAETIGLSADPTDGKLDILIEADGSQGIRGIDLEESGSVSLSADNENGAAMAAVSTPIKLIVRAVDGEEQEDPPVLETEVAFSPSGGIWIFTEDGFLSNEPWSGSLSIDVTGFLSDKGISGSATRVLVTLDNILFASSQAGAEAYIDKKEFRIVVRTPEPTTLALLAIAAGCALLMIARRKR